MFHSHANNELTVGGTGFRIATLAALNVLKESSEHCEKVGLLIFFELLHKTSLNSVYSKANVYRVRKMPQNS